ncbi:segregation/condensation protein A [Halalkalibacillus sediminis]|uniref:Segregation and condensation protein A n=1 Tax=Halalkalibacillus sediminis TaxID=2018042 RepID=A0A2I0QX44_9BACI|nr:segregation/condensation protein A [Halalkalibacillus sediminis]PKR78894.1 segregation/condensation protein A [Halalkalibacillus sediminis]
MNAVYNVKLDSFEGPLDLLLHLVNQYEIDIYDIPLKKITDQYMSYIHAMQDLHLDIASEYLVMAATLLAIKSQMLLPKQELEVEDEYEEDPRDELIERLIEYKKYKEASTLLHQLEAEGHQVHMRPPADLSSIEPTVQVEKSDECSVVDLTNAFQKVLRRRKLMEPIETTIQRQEISIDDRMDEIVRKLELADQAIEFEHLMEAAERFQIVASFLAVLELMKSMRITCKQDKNFENIYIALVEDHEWN